MAFEPIVEPDSQLIAIDCLKAQPWCNFPLFQPSYLPDGMKVLEQQLRPESKEGRSSFRCLMAGPGRKLSIKQFLYDWAPPAYDHPCLWRNDKISPKDATPVPRPFPIGDDIAWIGLNFKRQPGLSLTLKRTTVEMTAVEGTFADQELLDICKGLVPVEPKQTERILKTPFSALCYSNRHAENASDVPLSYWKYQRQKSWQSKSHPISQQPFQIPDYSLNSVLRFGDHETEFYYEHENMHSSLRILTTPTGQKDSIPYPPKLGDQTCHTQTLHVGGKELYHAFLTDVGAHEVIWQHLDTTGLLLIKPAPWTSRGWLKQILNSLLSTSSEM